MSAQLIEILPVIAVFVFGVSLGSFLNVVIERVPRNLTIGGRSHCPSCFHELGLSDLVPLLSFLLLKSHCRYCQSPISWQYPVIEFFTGLLFVLVYLTFPLPHSLFYLVLFSVLLALFVIDLKFGVVPTAIVYPAIVFTILVRFFLPVFESLSLYLRLVSDKSGFGTYLLRAGFFTTHFFLNFQPLVTTLIGAVMVALFFYLLVVVTRGRGMGSGDILYAFLVSLVAGFPNLFVVFFLTFLLGALVSLLLILAGKKKFGQTVPLGPFLSFSTFIGVFWGNLLLDWYVGLVK